MPDSAESFGATAVARHDGTAPPTRLTWSLVVCTYKRERVLPRCVRCALASTRRPGEVIVVDASPYWQATRDAVLGEFEAANPDVNFVYVGARRASLTAQRNQGLEMTTGDVAFMLDDDSLLFPDTAEHVMAVYEADADQEVVAVTPCFVGDVPDAHLGVVTPGHPTRGHAGADESKSSPLRKVLRALLWSHLQLLPYDGREGVRGVPKHLEKFGLIPTRFSSGSATFRTDAVRDARFEEMLERYAAGEDWDISDRIKHKGLIAFSGQARQCHLEAPGGRLAREVVFTLRYLNFFALHVLHSTDVRRSRRTYRRFMWRRVIGEALADLSKRQWRMPRARGTWRALKMLPAMFAKSKAEMRAWYPTYQRELIDSSNREDSAR
jgi:glycosyltransferase involved in cell wall biosynthesis